MSRPSPAATPPSAPRRRWRGAAASGLALILMAGAACADETDTPGPSTDVETDTDAPTEPVGEFEATAAYVHEVAAQSTSEGYHLEMQMTLDGEIDDATPLLMFGEVDGDEYHYTVDLGATMAEMAEAMGGPPMPAELEDLDFTMEMAGDDESLYLRAPLFSDPSFAGGAGDLGAIADLGDGWGYVDIAALGEALPTELAGALTSQGLDPQAVVDIISGVEDVEELGAGEIDGVPVQGLSAQTTMAELLEASGQDPDAIAEMSGGSTGSAEAIEGLYESETGIDVWIDEDGYLRRMELGWSFEDMAIAMGEHPDALGGASDLAFAYRIDMSDYGTTVDFEPPADAVDITEDYAALMG